jgi:hypothetical protein
MLFTYLSQTPEGINLRQQVEKQQALEHARERLERAVKGLEDKSASENEVFRQIYKQITPTFDLETTAFGPSVIGAHNKCWKYFYLPSCAITEWGGEKRFRIHWGRQRQTTGVVVEGHENRRRIKMKA